MKTHLSGPSNISAPIMTCFSSVILLVLFIQSLRYIKDIMPCCSVEFNFTADSIELIITSEQMNTIMIETFIQYRRLFIMCVEQLLSYVLIFNHMNVLSFAVVFPFLFIRTDGITADDSILADDSAQQSTTSLHIFET